MTTFAVWAPDMESPGVRDRMPACLAEGRCDRPPACSIRGQDGQARRGVPATTAPV